jgi:hypothetical protein
MAAHLLCITMTAPATSRIAEFFDLASWSAWFADLDRGFIFLLLLPFVVAVIGLWSLYFDEDDRK